MANVGFGRMEFAARWLLAVVVALLTGSCLSDGLLHAQEDFHSAAIEGDLEPDTSLLGYVDVEVGRRAPVVDGVGWAFGIPRKLLLWDRRADNHNVSHGTVSEIASYIEARGLNDVKVRVNQYDPGGEWKRLVQNKRVGAGWRYTIGTLSTLRYTFFPGRLFGRDNYNPYTDTLSVFSDSPTLALAEAAYAKDIHQREFPGTYATVQQLPLAAMWHETLATGEVLQYVSINGSIDDQDKVRQLLYARYGMELGGVLSDVLPDGSSLFPVVGAAGGHVVAAGESSQKQQQVSQQEMGRGLRNLDKLVQQNQRE